jgi:hypothetical protein
MASNPSSRKNVAERAEEQAEAYRLRLRGHSLRAIGSIMGFSHEKARQLIALEAEKLTLPLADELRKQQLDRLNDARLAVMAVLERKHVHISDGRVVRDKDPETGLLGEPIEDDAPVLQAVDRLVKIEDRIAKLLGLDAPVQSEINATVETRPAELLTLIERARQQSEEDEARLRYGPA